MADTLEIFGVEYTNVAGIIATNDNGDELTFTRGGGSGGSKQEKTGTITGNGTNVIQISCDFEPQEIYIHGDLTSDVSLRGIISFILIKDRELVITQDSSTSGTPNNAWIIKTITGYNEEYSSTEPYASYSNGVLTIDTVMNSGSARWASGVSYSYSLVTYESVATNHVIHLEFSDSTDTDINVYYNDALLSTMITAYTPETYGQKTVTLAQLDGVTWYEPSAIPLNTQLIDYTAVTSGYVVDGDTGEETVSQWSSCSDFTLIDPSMTFSYIGYQWYDLVFYNSSKSYISSITMYQDTDVTITNDYAHGTLTPSKIPSTAKYVRINSYPTNPSSTQLSLIRTA